MKISELSAASGVSIPTIKFYIRAGLLPRGESAGPTRAEYGEGHLRRLDLIRVLREVAGLNIGTIKDTLDAMDALARAGKGPEHLAVALRALSDPLEVPEGEERLFEGAQQRVDELFATMGWTRLGRRAPGRDDLVRALVAIDRHWPGGIDAAGLERYARTAEELASYEVPADWDPGADPIDALRYAVLGTLLFEPVVVSLRRLAHAQRSETLAGR